MVSFARGSDARGDWRGRRAGTKMLAMSMKEERQVAQELSPAIAWPTLGLALLLPLPMGRLVPAAAYTMKQARLKPEELRIHAVTVTALQLVFWVAVLLGYAKIAFLLYWVPMMIGLVLLNVFFQWLPHVPFDK